MDSAEESYRLRQMHSAIMDELAGSLHNLREMVLRGRLGGERPSFLDAFGAAASERGRERDEAFASGVTMCVEEALRTLRSLDMNKVARRLAERAEERPAPPAPSWPHLPRTSSQPRRSQDPSPMENTE